jgi:hypothetical protein
MGKNKQIIRHTAFKTVPSYCHPLACYVGYYKKGQTFYVAYCDNGTRQLMVVEGDPVKYNDCYYVAEETLDSKRSQAIMENLRKLYQDFS